MKNEPEAILLLNPVTNYLSVEVYACIVKKTGLKPEEDLLKHLNFNYYSFVDAVNLVAAGEIEDLLRMSYSKPPKSKISFSSLKKAQEELKEYPLYFYDMSEKKYKWIKFEAKMTTAKRSY